MIGTPTAQDLDFLSDDEAKVYISKFAQRKPRDLSQMYPNIEPAGIELVQRLLRFNPNFRPSAKECLKSPYFDIVR